MENALTLAGDLKAMKPCKVVTDGKVSDQFVYIYNSVHGGGGEGAYNRESTYFVQQIKASEALQKCTGPSIYYALIDLAVKGLSLQPGVQAQCYLLPRNVFVGYDQNRQKVYETTCQLTISGYGELALRKAAGQILYADNPVIVYDGDFFETGDRDGRKYVNYEARFPRKSNRIIACYVRIIRPDRSVDYGVMTEPDWTRLAGFSAKQNKGTANPLYSSDNGQIDAGFLIAKTVKHAFRTYPRIAVGMGSGFAADVPDEQQGLDPYGGVAQALEQQKGGDAPQQPAQAQTADPAPEPEDFTQPQDYGRGVSYPDPDDDDTF
ncbi:MAG: recombinase RecT [Bacteroidales bacterium]|nr:recombinase RecT [Bacteroidales bacterium]